MNRIPSREEQLFAEAISRPTEEWPAFLDRACSGEPELRARLDALLNAHQGTASLRAPRALALLGRLDESRALITRLEAIDYRPLQPWPAPVAAHFRQIN